MTQPVSMLLKPLVILDKTCSCFLGTSTRTSLPCTPQSLTMSSKSLWCSSPAEASAPLLIVKVIFLTVQRSMGWQDVSIKAVLSYDPLMHDMMEQTLGNTSEWSDTTQWHSITISHESNHVWRVWSNICFTSHSTNACLTHIIWFET